MTPTRLAVLSTLAIACGAFAQTSSLTLAGRVDLGPQYIDDGGNTTRRLDSGTYTASRLIVRGSEELGGGLSALFYLESRFNADLGATQSADKFWNAGSYVGLSSTHFGTITLGRQYVPIFWPFLFGDDTGPLRLHGYSAVQSVQRSNLARVTAAVSPIKAAGTLDSISDGVYTLNITSAFEDNLVIYKLPSFSGLTITGAVSAPEGYPSGGGKVYAGNAEYRNGALYLGYGVNRKEGRVPPGSNTAQKVTEQVITGTYAVVQDVNLWGNFHPWNFDSNGSKLSGRDFMLGVSFRMPSGMVWANYAAKSIGDGCTDCNSRGFGIGYHYFLSKRSELWVATARVSNDANSANSLNGFAPDAPGKSVTGLAAGITLTF